MSSEPLQQGNLFTGSWEPKRPRAVRPEQTTMFSLRETFDFGARAHPTLADADAPALVLKQEDVRTPEQIERDLMRQAEERTSPMFADDAMPSDDVAAEQDDIDAEPLAPLSVPEPTSKRSVYAGLVTLAREQAMTLWVDELYRGRFYAQLPQAMAAALSAGLLPAEITAAIQIGEFQGNQACAAAPSPTIEKSSPNDPPAVSPVPLSATLPHEGFRARMRREHCPLRLR